MSDRTVVAVGALLGAAAGLVGSYLLFTDEGRRLRADVEPELNVLMGEVGRLKGAFDVMRQSLSADTATSSWPRRSA